MADEIQKTDIEKKILVIRNQQVMLDRDIAELYGVKTKLLNQAVKRNRERFPEEFMFQLTDTEYLFLRSQFVTLKSNEGNLKSQIVTSNLLQESLRSQNATLKKGESQRGKHSKYLPYAFTEQGVAMLSAVLRSERAVQVSIQIMKAFVAMRHFLATNAQLLSEINDIRHHQLESDKRIDELFDKMDSYHIEQKQGIFFQGQIFDAYSFFLKLIQKAKKDIILIDGYIDLSVLDRLAKKRENVLVTIYTLQNPKMKEPPVTSLDVQKFNSQYPVLSVEYTVSVHDRFLIIDHSELYHIGASIKDLGKKCFAFEKMEDAEKLIPLLLSSF